MRGKDGSDYLKKGRSTVVRLLFLIGLSSPYLILAWVIGYDQFIRQLVEVFMRMNYGSLVLCISTMRAIHYVLKWRFEGSHAYQLLEPLLLPGIELAPLTPIMLLAKLLGNDTLMNTASNFYCLAVAIVVLFVPLFIFLNQVDLVVYMKGSPITPIALTMMAYFTVEGIGCAKETIASSSPELAVLGDELIRQLVKGADFLVPILTNTPPVWGTIEGLDHTSGAKGSLFWTMSAFAMVSTLYFYFRLDRLARDKLGELSRASPTSPSSTAHPPRRESPSLYIIGVTILFATLLAFLIIIGAGSAIPAIPSLRLLLLMAALLATLTTVYKIPPKKFEVT